MAERKIDVKYTIVENIFAGEEKKLETFTQAGVYILKDKGGRILYIGEADNLSSRVKKHLNGIDKATRVLEGHKYIYNIDLYILDECEPLPKKNILEIDLILEHNPPFNSKFTKREGNKKEVYRAKEHILSQLMGKDTRKQNGHYTKKRLTMKDLIYQV